MWHQQHKLWLLVSYVRKKLGGTRELVHGPEVPQTHLNSVELAMPGTEENSKYGLTFFDTQSWGLVCVGGCIIGQQ